MLHVSMNQTSRLKQYVVLLLIVLHSQLVLLPFINQPINKSDVHIL